MGVYGSLKSTIGRNDLRPLLSETEKIAKSLKAEIDMVAQDYGVNVRAVRITDVGTPQLSLKNWRLSPEQSGAQRQRKFRQMRKLL